MAGNYQPRHVAPETLAGAEQGWAELVQQLWAELLTQPAASALYKMASRIFGEYRAQIARLRAELDLYEGRRVYYCMGRDMQEIADQMQGQGAHEPGTILRATDTGRELEWQNSRWQLRTTEGSQI